MGSKTVSDSNEFKFLEDINYFGCKTAGELLSRYSFDMDRDISGYWDPHVYDTEWIPKSLTYIDDKYIYCEEWRFKKIRIR